jgi:Tfp pilus assembly protein PilN
MVNINLIPWRDARRIYQTRELKKILCAGIMLLLISVIVVHVLLVKGITGTNHRINGLKNEMQQFHPPLITYIKRPQHKFKQRYNVSTLFAELGKLDETGKICFTEIARRDHVVSFKGRMRSTIELTDYLNQWKAGYLFSEIKIKLIEQQENGLFQFIFDATERN